MRGGRGLVPGPAGARAAQCRPAQRLGPDHLSRRLGRGGGGADHPGDRTPGGGHPGGGPGLVLLPRRHLADQHPVQPGPQSRRRRQRCARRRQPHHQPAAAAVRPATDRQGQCRRRADHLPEHDLHHAQPASTGRLRQSLPGGAFLHRARGGPGVPGRRPALFHAHLAGSRGHGRARPHGRRRGNGPQQPEHRTAGRVAGGGGQGLHGARGAGLFNPRPVRPDAGAGRWRGAVDGRVLGRGGRDLGGRRRGPGRAQHGDHRLQRRRLCHPAGGYRPYRGGARRASAPVPLQRLGPGGPGHHPPVPGQRPGDLRRRSQGAGRDQPQPAQGHQDPGGHRLHGVHPPCDRGGLDHHGHLAGSGGAGELPVPGDLAGRGDPHHRGPDLHPVDLHRPGAPGLLDQPAHPAGPGAGHRPGGG